MPASGLTRAPPRGRLAPRPARPRAPPRASVPRRSAATAPDRRPRSPSSRQPGPLQLRPPASKRSSRPARACGGLWIEVEQQGEVGLQTARRERVHGGHLVHAQPARRALVGERGVEEAVGHHHAAASSAGRITWRTSSRPRRREQQRLGLAREVHRRVLEQIADPLPGRRPARLADPEGLVAERLDQQLCLRRLARAVDALEGDVQAGHGGRRSSGRDADSGHGRLRLHRLKPRRRPARAGRRGDRSRRPLHREAARTGRRDRGPAPSWSRPTSATPRPCPTLVGRTTPEAIFHLAAQIAVRKSAADPAMDSRINVEGT